MTANVITLVSHTDQCLPVQVFALRKYFPGCKITAIFGPFDDRVWPRPAPFVRPVESSIETAVIPVGAISKRQPKIDLYRWMFDLLAGIHGPKLLLHGDLFPVAPVNVEDILQGKLIAARKGRTATDGLWTWAAFDQQFDGWDGIEAHGIIIDYGVPVQQYEIERRDDGMEACDPCWLHVDKQQWAQRDSGFDTRLETVKQQIGYEPTDEPFCTLDESAPRWQATTVKKKMLKPQSSGPGTHLKRLLRKIGIKPRPNCDCNAMAATMDRMGCDWSRKNTPRIVDVMRREAKKRKLPFLRPVARRLVLMAIRRARKGK